jgi:hypothetical protein
MNSYALSPVGHDLDGLTFPTNPRGGPQVKRQYSFNQDFGFEPPLTEQDIFNPYPDTANKLANWSGFGNRSMSHQTPQEVLSKTSSAHRHSLSLPQFQQPHGALGNTLTHSGVGALAVGSLTLNTKNLHNPASAMSIYGQVTPPRSNSASSEPSKMSQDPTSATSNRSTTKRRRAKAENKNPVTPPQDSNTPKPRKAGGRKKANTTQLSTANQDDKRKASLEKNRVAAAKCRINKKEKTEQLQRDSHTKAQENGRLRGLVESMEAERSTLAAYLGAHASCGDCRNPSQLKETLRMFQESEMMKRFPGLVGDPVTADASPVLSVSGKSMDSGFFDDAGFNSTAPVPNPPLPDFNMSGDYDMHSPLPD